MENNYQLALVAYTEEYFNESARWLNDPELKRLTNTPEEPVADRRRWFEQLGTMADYKIWGGSCNGIPIAACGIKNIRADEGELWGYIGEKKYWSSGFGTWGLMALEQEAMKLGLKRLYLKVLCENYKAINLYFKLGYRIERIADQHGYLMTKAITPTAQ